MTVSPAATHALPLFERVPDALRGVPAGGTEHVSAYSCSRDSHRDCSCRPRLAAGSSEGNHLVQLRGRSDPSVHLQNQRDDATLSSLPTCHLFVSASPAKTAAGPGGADDSAALRLCRRKQPALPSGSQSSQTVHSPVSLYSLLPGRRRDCHFDGTHPCSHAC